MSLITKVKNRSAWVARKIKKNNRFVYKYYIGPDGKYTPYHLLPDYIYIKILYKRRMGKKLDLKSPKTFNEKLNWLKLYDRKPIYTTMVDKYEVKDYVARLIGEEYIIPTLGVWDSFDDIDFDSLPERFVLKCTHDSGGVYICHEKAKMNKKQLRWFFNYCLSKNYYYSCREWPYKNVKPRIIAEEYIEDLAQGDLKDYKIFCFSGNAKVLFVASERNSIEETKFDFFDSEFKHLPIVWNGHPNAKVSPEKPEHFDEMLEIASKLSQDIPQVRVDLYNLNGRILFGELTFSHWSGFVPFEPEEWDKKLGDMIILPNKG